MITRIFHGFRYGGRWAELVINSAKSFILLRLKHYYYKGVVLSRLLEVSIGSYGEVTLLTSSLVSVSNASTSFIAFLFLKEDIAVGFKVNCCRQRARTSCCLISNMGREQRRVKLASIEDRGKIYTELERRK